MADRRSARMFATAQVKEWATGHFGLADRAVKTWASSGLQPIGLHDLRHTAATWLDSAGVSPKVASILMGHSTPERQAGAAQITLARYTHLMPDAIEKARAQLDRWLAAESAKGWELRSPSRSPGLLEVP